MTELNYLGPPALNGYLGETETQNPAGLKPGV